jgi:hypothetical protein
MTTAPNADEMKRLTLIRHLFNLGVIQSHEPEPTSALALLQFHDAVEMFLLLACRRYGAKSTKKMEFLQYFDLLSGTGVQLTQFPGMRTLNSARVALKHEAIIASTLEIEGIRATTTNFFLENTEKVFGVSFEKISLASLINDPDILQHVISAEEWISQNNLRDTLASLQCAFTLSLRKYELNAKDNSHQIFGYTLRGSVRRYLSPFLPSNLARGLTGEAASAAKDIANAVQNMASAYGDAILVIGYGLDFHTYLLFKANAPVAHEMADGDIHIEFLNKPTEDLKLVKKCLDFVVDTAIRLKV